MGLKQRHVYIVSLNTHSARPSNVLPRNIHYSWALCLVFMPTPWALPLCSLSHFVCAPSPKFFSDHLSFHSSYLAVLTVAILSRLLYFSVIYLGSTMAFGTASVCLTVIVLNLHHRGSHRPVPQWVRVGGFLYYLARAFGFPPVNKYPLYDSVQETPTITEKTLTLQKCTKSTYPYALRKIVCRGMGDHYLMTEINSHRESSANSPRVTKEEVHTQQTLEDMN